MSNMRADVCLVAKLHLKSSSEPGTINSKNADISVSPVVDWDHIFWLTINFSACFI